MSKSLKSIEKQKQDIVKYISNFGGTKVYDQVAPNYVRVDCPNVAVLEVLLNYYQTNEYHVDTVVIGRDTKDFSFMIKLLPPAIDSAALVAMMREYLSTLDDKKPIGLLKTEKDHAARTFIHFLVAIGVQGKDL